MKYLVSKGVRFNKDKSAVKVTRDGDRKIFIYPDGISHTTSRHRRSYYLVESKENLALLNEYRSLTKKT